MGAQMINREHLSDFLEDVEREVLEAAARYPAFNSAHEGYAVLLEEVDELVEEVGKLWAEVKRKQGARDPAALLEEAKHVAAMAARFAVEIAIGNPQR